MKTIITLALICVNILLFGDESLSNNEIRSQYCSITNSVQHAIFIDGPEAKRNPNDPFSTTDSESERPSYYFLTPTNIVPYENMIKRQHHIATLSYLRSSNVIPLIFNYSILNQIFIRRPFDLAISPALGCTRNFTDSCNSAVKKINPSLDEYLTALVYVQQHSKSKRSSKIEFLLSQIDENYCCISVITNRLLEIPNISTEVQKVLQTSASTMVLTNEFPVVSGGDTNICQQYDTWQDMLITRFNEEKQGGSTNILGTIDTMAFIRSEKAIPILEENLTISPITNSNTVVYPAAEALVAIAPPFGRCLANIYDSEAESINEELWFNITRRLNPEALRYILNKKADEGDARAQRLKETSKLIEN